MRPVDPFQHCFCPMAYGRKLGLPRRPDRENKMMRWARKMVMTLIRSGDGELDDLFTNTITFWDTVYGAVRPLAYPNVSRYAPSPFECLRSALTREAWPMDDVLELVGGWPEIGPTGCEEEDEEASETSSSSSSSDSE